MVSDTSMPAATSDPVPNEPNSHGSLSPHSLNENHSSNNQRKNSALDKDVKIANGSAGYIEEDIDVDVVVHLVNNLQTEPDRDLQNGSSEEHDCSNTQENSSNQTVNTKCESNLENDNETTTTKQAVSNEEGKSDQEYFLIQDTGFTVKIAAPGLDTFDIQVSAMELVQEIHQLLMDREDTCHRTCFSLQLDGTTLDNFAELKNVEGLKEDSLIKVVEEAYTIREARIHVRHVRDLLKSIDPADSYNGAECNSLTFLNVITQGDILEKKKSRPDSVDCTPPDYILPNCKDRSLLPLQPLGKDQKSFQALKVLMSSGWNPPPGTRKLHGDLMYLYVVTLEDKHYHITSSTRGFYLNQCTEDNFNPKPANPKVVYHSLIELLSQVSPLFKRNFAIIQKKRTQKHPFERVATPYQVYSWTAPNFCHTIDSIRAEDAFSSKLGYEEHIPGQTRDWNEELQTTRELPRKSLPERLLRERAIFKVHSDFVAAATRGAMAVIDGNVMAINPGEETKMQMFIWNNIFFSLGFDVRDHYKEFGGDAAAYAAPCNDLQGVRAYNSVDIEGLYTLGTGVIDYRGYRVTAQSIIPGILEREQEQSVVYGSVDFGKTVVTNQKYMDLLNKAGQHLKILPHKVLNEKNEEVELCSSVECKGIVGNDSRHYILDLLRTFPPDMNYLPIEGEEYNKETKALGYPRHHKHKLCCLRQELVDAFVETKYLLFIKLAAFHLQQIGLKGINRDGEKKDNEKKDKKTKKVMQENDTNANKDSKAICHEIDNCQVPMRSPKCHISPTSGLVNLDPNILPVSSKVFDINASDPSKDFGTSNTEICETNSVLEESNVPSAQAKDGEQSPDDRSDLSKDVNCDVPQGLVAQDFQANEESQSEKTNKLVEEEGDLDLSGKSLVFEAEITNEAEKEGVILIPTSGLGIGLREVSNGENKVCEDESQESIKKLESDFGSADKEFQFMNSSKSADKETYQYKKIVESYANGETFEDSTKDVIRKAAQAVGSLKETEFDIRFNLDVFSVGVTHPDPEGEQLQKQRRLIKDAADFLLTVQVPSLIRDCLEHSASPIDGFTLTEALHSRGINIRYLGRIADMLAKIPQLQYVYSLCVCEIICRAAKHVFTIYLQGVETICLAAAIAHFLNCFLSSALALSTPTATEEMQIKSAKRKGKKKGKHSPFATSDNEWASLTQASLWKEFKSELDSYYNWKLTAESMDVAVEQYGIQKVSLLRSFCLKMGIQILLKDYNFDNRNRATFTEDDIINIFPIVKHINPRATDAYNFYSTGQLKIQQGFLKEGYELISEAFNLLNNVYGAMHPEIAQCLRMLARLNYLMGDHTEALAFQQKAVLMSERVNGIDHPYTITEYTHLALYCFANSQISTSLKLLYRARYLALLVCGENHPEVAVLDSNIGLILHAVGEYDLSLRFLQNALKLNTKYYGIRSLKVAVNYHLVARTQSCMGDFRGALQNEKETYAIYKFQLGEEHEKTKESSDCLRHLTQQAVVLQKTMNEIYRGTAGAILPPIQIQAPSMSSVLDMLNIINGILFVQISPQDIENIKGEMERRQQKEKAEETSNTEPKASDSEDKVNVDVAR